MHPASNFICFLIAAAATVALLIFVLPKQKDGKLPKCFQIVHDVCHCKKIFVEQILKILYVLTTCFCVVFGLAYIIYGIRWHYGWIGFFLYGLIVIVLGSLLARVVYELLMLFVWHVRNTADIRRKLDRVLKEQTVPEEETPSEPQPNMVYCSQCGTCYDANEGNCPNCGKT